MMKSVVLVLVACAVCALAAPWRPVVLMHGLTANSTAMAEAKAWIEADFPGIYVKNMEIGNGALTSLFEFLPNQVDEFNAKIKADAQLSRGFNLIGHSQGGLISRAYIEKFNNPPVYNFLTWATPHGGQYGVPQIDIPELAKLFSQLLEGNLTAQIQHALTFATYWKDPMNIQRYLNQNLFLADINNERPTKNDQYKKNILSLNHWLMEWSTVDKIVIPNTSGKFESYAEGQTTTVVPLKNSAQYTGDWLGIRTLDTAGKLTIGQTDCVHGDFPRAKCKNWYIQYSRQFLNNTLA